MIGPGYDKNLVKKNSLAIKYHYFSLPVDYFGYKESHGTRNNG